MRISISLFKALSIILFLSVVQSCGNEDEGCNFETITILEGEEFYYFEREGILILSSLPGFAETEFLTCDPNYEVPDVGYDSIVAVFGNYLVDCNTGACIEIDSVRRPFCEKNVQLDTSIEASIYRRWNIAYLIQQQDSLYPSCNVPNLYLDIENGTSDDVSFPDLVTGVIGVNRVTFNLNLADSLFSIDNLRRTGDIGAPYVQLVENRIYEFLQQEDLSYTKNSNLLKISSDAKNETLVFELN